ncbi:16S rRNA (cytidine(1402)-2'-O)-methyltransferase [Streptococcus sp. sy004]|uniref:16S rRNA (cytidine(1402)-2'-O)-methyltransferase n=1 Tax=Streptococcus sp. sy004 TaxID=2600149 RepID=UPI0011B55300|nr:16S rRNA (cytidine(1402)-2'-O)-methyltransferase [Streptococcus sp. sy004]TWT09909.1 16S rRNA (cytidine(1402)-2'-O)-methyltransferase [Streptococcus sp. sy004]
MQIQKSFKEVRVVGSLYLVPTPIGNLQDMTFRAIDVLKSVDVICAEDTRTTGQLLKYFDIETPQTSFHEHNAYEKIGELIELLLSGKSLAQVSDAGMPSISDPGHDLVQAALAREIPVVSLPGASAGITALIASGLAPQPHIFYGFLPRKKGQQLSFFEEKKAYPETQIFYESPYRVLDTLTNMLAVYGDRQVVLVRELTKIYEEYQRASLSELIEALEEKAIKGECLLIVSGAALEDRSLADQDPVALVKALVVSGHKPNQAIKAVAKEYGLNRQELYQAYHQQKEDHSE